VVHLVLSDIHGNLEALEAVLADAGPVDAVLFLGDMVGYGPNPNEVTERVRALPHLTALVGNHDLAALGRLNLGDFNGYAQAAARWTAAELTPENKEYLLSLDPRADTAIALLAHASPRDPVWEYVESDRQGPPNFALMEGNVALVGHTHVPRVVAEVGARDSRRATARVSRAGETVELMDGIRRIVNPGGVGQPRDGDPRAAYALWDTESGAFQFRRVPYGIRETQRKILEAGLPPPLASRLSSGM
jgi:diadenosine tetraphosphatase ApaH/serine/threonine PP2A family protein phosphatase